MTVLNCEARGILDGAAPSRQSILTRLRLWLSAQKGVAPHSAARDPWISAIDAVAGMDEHTLKDIGAPTWLMSEVRHRQSLAAKRLIDLQIR